MSLRKINLSFLFIYLLFCIQTKAQLKGKYQYRWALFHPIAAIKVNHIYKKNYPVYQQIKSQKKLDTIENGGKLDAFRHSFFMACFAQKVNPKKLVKLSIAHEKDDVYLFQKKKKYEYMDVPDSTSIQMDLYNNQVGIELGRKYRKLSPLQLKDSVMNDIYSHKVRVIKP